MSLPSARIPRQLARLNAIARGPGAIKLPANVKAINLSFKFQNKDGHMGPRYVCTMNPDGGSFYFYLFYLNLFFFANWFHF